MTTAHILLLPLLLAATLTARQITTDGLPKRDPHIWADGRTLTYTVETIGTARMNILRHDLNAGTSTFFFNGNNQTRSDRELRPSRDGKCYAYNSVSGLSSRITFHNETTGLKTTMPNMGRASWNNWPTVSPNGRYMAFTEGATLLYLYDSDLGLATKENLRRISTPDSTHSDLFPSFSPDGRTLAFASNRDKDYEIYLMDREGSNQRRITHSRGIDRHPMFSPDGRYIAFTSNRDGNPEIYVMDADGNNPRRITQHPERDDYCCWHPDGKQLALVSEREGRFDIHLLDVSQALANK